MKLVILVVCLVSLWTLSSAHFMETDTPYTDESNLPEPADYLNDTVWIKYGNGVEMNATSIINDCNTYGTEKAPSVCPEGKEYYNGFCVIKCPVDYTRVSTCACKSPQGKTFDDCQTYGDPKSQGLPGGPICRQDEESWGMHCYSSKCPTGFTRFAKCGCAIFRRVKTKSA